MSAEPGKPRGVLRPQPASGNFQHERRVASALLADFVEHYWYVRWDPRELPPVQQATLPHPNVHLVIERNEANIYGVQSKRFERRLEGLDFVFGIKFRAGGFYPFLKSPVSALANGILPVQSVFASAGQGLMPRITACIDFDAMVGVAEAFLLDHLPLPDPNVVRASVLVAAVADDLCMTSVDQLMTKAGMDKRSLQRLFQKYVGIGPKWVIRRYRLHEAIERIQNYTNVNWVELALELGYFDQSHFVRDFSALIGQSPAEYARSLGKGGAS
ncbi:helix-turn-helix domain-containing protein [Undibacterium terreum]|uniref:AraC family transcriptional regulator n=1 Tax=Undibacterium terreum TaxID=1224302 RepID=A0A916UY41_9BURK|nr:helix-turn-helix domain-containing protein [Undibacterium terreum]GGC92306.1 AraC family transcriptional regulator [Undibacterium terreum]